MVTPEKRIYYLLQSYSLGIISPEEEQELFAWIQSTDDSTFLNDHIHKIYEDSVETDDAYSVNWEKIYGQITDKIDQRNTPVKKISVWQSKWAQVAAVVLLFISSAVAYNGFISDKNPEQIAALVPNNITNDTVKIPKAILKAGSDEVYLNENDTSFQLGGNVVDLRGGQLNIGNKNSEQYTLTTPIGIQFKVVLADGTIVWLNTASSLSYPSVFTGTNREVAVNGEAYFEVAKDKNHPFVVNVGEQTIKVLGTSFNVQAYTNEPELVTTLFTGSLRVATSKGSLLLKPGQQSEWNKEGDIRLNKKADLEQVIAWKSGYFRYHKADLKTIMRQLSRWYDLEVIYEPGLKPQYFGGLIDRNNDISKVLQMLEATNDVHFKLEGNKVIVAPIKE